MSMNYSKYLKTEIGTKLTKGQFRTVSTAIQRSFARGKEYEGWIMYDGTMNMRYEGQTRSGISLGESQVGRELFFKDGRNLTVERPL